MGGLSFIVVRRSSSLLFLASGEPGSPPWSPPLPEEGEAGSEPPEDDDEVDTDTEVDEAHDADEEDDSAEWSTLPLADADVAGRFNSLASNDAPDDADSGRWELSAAMAAPSGAINPSSASVC
uniref:Putative secreted protein n=1 Tax=Anopheles triannulatus TaxID=58253 RepID=A0A2M4B3Q9_9DIPT